MAWYHRPTQPHQSVPLQLYNTIYNRQKTSEKSACKAALKIYIYITARPNPCYLSSFVDCRTYYNIFCLTNYDVDGTRRSFYLAHSDHNCRSSIFTLLRPGKTGTYSLFFSCWFDCILVSRIQRVNPAYNLARVKRP